MKNVASAKWTLAAVAAATVVGLALASVASVEAVQSGQSTREAETAARIQAELEARLAQVQTRRARESMQLALVSAERALQRAPRAMTIRGIGSCDSFGELVLDYAEDLELTEDQIDTVRGSQRAARRDGIERRADIEVAEMDLEALYEADDPDLAAVRAKLEALAMLRVDEQMAGFTLRREVRAALTPDQLDKLDEQRADHDNIRIVVSGFSTSHRIGRIGC